MQHYLLIGYAFICTEYSTVRTVPRQCQGGGTVRGGSSRTIGWLISILQRSFENPPLNRERGSGAIARCPSTPRRLFTIRGGSLQSKVVSTVYTSVGPPYSIIVLYSPYSEYSKSRTVMYCR